MTTIQDPRFDNDKPVDLFLARYGKEENSPVAILAMIDDGYGPEPFTTYTINLEDYGLVPKPGHVFIKAYNEGEGAVEVLVDQGVISDPVWGTFGLYNTAYAEAKLLIEQE